MQSSLSCVNYSNPLTSTANPTNPTISLQQCKTLDHKKIRLKLDNLHKYEIPADAYHAVENDSYGWYFLYESIHSSHRNDWWAATTGLLDA